MYKDIWNKKQKTDSCIVYKCGEHNQKADNALPPLKKCKLHNSYLLCVGTTPSHSENVGVRVQTSNAVFLETLENISERNPEKLDQMTITERDLGCFNHCLRKMNVRSH